MAKNFLLPPPWLHRGWKLKIRDRERIEPPHVTLIMKTESWRFGLRKADFLDVEPDPARIPDDLVNHLRREIQNYIESWNEMYPENPV